MHWASVQDCHRSCNGHELTYLHHPVDVFHIVDVLVHIQISATRLQSAGGVKASSEKFETICKSQVRVESNALLYRQGELSVKLLELDSKMAKAAGDVPLNPM